MFKEQHSIVCEKKLPFVHDMPFSCRKFNSSLPFFLSSQYALLTSLQVVRAIKDLACVILRTPATSFISIWLRTAMPHVESANVSLRGDSCSSSVRWAAFAKDYEWRQR